MAGGSTFTYLSLHDTFYPLALEGQKCHEAILVATVPIGFPRTGTHEHLQCVFVRRETAAD